MLRTIHRNRDYPGELRMWTRTLEVVPQNTRAMNNLGLALSNLGKPQAALEYFRRVLILHPDFREASFNRARELGLLETHEQAIE